MNRKYYENFGIKLAEFLLLLKSLFYESRKLGKKVEKFSLWNRRACSCVQLYQVHVSVVCTVVIGPGLPGECVVLPGLPGECVVLPGFPMAGV